MSQPFHVAEIFTGISGKYVEMQDSIDSFQAVLGGEFDEYPEGAFYMVGAGAEIVEKAKTM